MPPPRVRGPVHFLHCYSLSFCKTVITAHKGNIGFDFVNDCASIWFTLPFIDIVHDETHNVVFKRKLYEDIFIDSKELNNLCIYYDTLIDTHFFEITKLRRIISEIEQPKIVNTTWLFELKSSIAEMDEEKYFRLIEMIKPQIMAN